MLKTLRLVKDFLFKGYIHAGTKSNTKGQQMESRFCNAQTANDCRCRTSDTKKQDIQKLVMIREVV